MINWLLWKTTRVEAIWDDHDYGQEAFVSKNRFVAYGVYELPIGRGKNRG